MSCDNPMGDGSPVALRLLEPHETFLREALTSFKKGAEGDLKSKAELADRPRMEREVAAYDRLLDGLDLGSVVPDEDVIRVATTLADVIDDANAYQQVLKEHRACCRLLEALEEGEA